MKWFLNIQRIYLLSQTLTCIVVYLMHGYVSIWSLTDDNILEWRLYSNVVDYLSLEYVNMLATIFGVRKPNWNISNLN